LPWRDSTPHYKFAVRPIYAYVEDILATFYNDNHSIAGDFNFECRPGDLGFDCFNDMFKEYSIHHCDDLFQNGPKYTYFHNSFNHTSWLDHFFVSDTLSASRCNFNILDNGANCSDHCPVSCDMLIDISVQLSSIVQEPHIAIP